METIERDYSPKGVKFYYIYKTLAHPENNGYVSPITIEERLMHVAEAKKKLGTRIHWLCDSMNNDAKHALGDRPNSEFVIDPQGLVVVARSWSRPQQLRDDLARLVGKVEPVTTVASLNMPRLQSAPSKAPKGIVPRIRLPGKMQPMKITAMESKSPHYAKLRAEMSGGQIYLGLFLDPLYKVHWNNKAPTLKLSIETPDGVSVSPSNVSAPNVEVAADADPREFLVSLSGRSDSPIRVTVNYFACDDAETFCVPVEQIYEVFLERDADGGSRRSTSARGGAGRSGNSRQQGAGSRMREMMRQHPLLSAIDRNGDGKLSAKELAAAPASLRHADENGDGQLSGSELLPQRMRSRMRRGR